MLKYLLVGVALASENSALYKCNTVDKQCVFVIADESGVTLPSGKSFTSVGPHNLAIPFTSIGGANSRQGVYNNGAAMMVSVIPWGQGDHVAAASAITGDKWNNVQIFEYVATLRDGLMYSPSTLVDVAEWNKHVRAFRDCGVKIETKPHTPINEYGLDDLHALISDTSTWTVPQSVHNPILQFLEEGAIDLLCVATAGPIIDQKTGQEFSRCTTARAQLSLEAGEWSDCWVAGYEGIAGVAPVIDSSMDASRVTGTYSPSPGPTPDGPTPGPTPGPSDAATLVLSFASALAFLF